MIKFDCVEELVDHYCDISTMTTRCVFRQVYILTTQIVSTPFREEIRPSDEELVMHTILK